MLVRSRNLIDSTSVSKKAKYTGSVVCSSPFGHRSGSRRSSSVLHWLDMDHSPVPDAVALQPWGCGYRRLQEEGVPGSAPHEPERDSPPDFVLWSLFNAIFLNCFCCLGFLALVFSVKSRDRKMVGDLEGAQHYGATAKLFNIIVAVFLGLCVVASITCLVFMLH